MVRTPSKAGAPVETALGGQSRDQAAPELGPRCTNRPEVDGLRAPLLCPLIAWPRYVVGARPQRRASTTIRRATSVRTARASAVSGSAAKNNRLPLITTGRAVPSRDSFMKLLDYL